VQMEIYADNLFGAGTASPTSITWTHSVLTVMSKRDQVDTREQISIFKYNDNLKSASRRTSKQYTVNPP